MQRVLESSISLYFTHRLLNIFGAGWTAYFLQRELSLRMMRVMRTGGVAATHTADLVLRQIHKRKTALSKYFDYLDCKCGMSGFAELKTLTHMSFRLSLPLVFGGRDRRRWPKGHPWPGLSRRRGREKAC